VNDEPTTHLISAIVEAIDGRSDDQTNLITASLVRRAWPAGIGDRIEPAALDWVRRWGPNSVLPDYLEECTCLGGRCIMCN
jgi:hypothetical protein